MGIPILKRVVNDYCVNFTAAFAFLCVGTIFIPHIFTTPNMASLSKYSTSGFALFEISDTNAHALGSFTHNTQHGFGIL